MTTDDSRPAVLKLIGRTPLVRVTRFDTGPCELFLKLESQNPGGSIKDRIGVAMIDAAERDGRLKPGGTVIEATAGNTGLGLALVARAKGYRVVLVVPDKMSTEKVLHLNPLAHETSTGPEIWQQCGHELDAIVVGVGSAGTMTGLTHFFQRVQPKLEFVLADPVGSILRDHVLTGTHGTAGSW